MLPQLPEKPYHRQRGFIGKRSVVVSTKQKPSPTLPKRAPDPAVQTHIMIPLPNYTLSTVCPACNAPTVRRACKVRCERCGFMWDCSEL
jgi:hypothetical protein